MPERRFGFMLPILAVLTILLGLYAGAYFGLVGPAKNFMTGTVRPCYVYESRHFGTHRFESDSLVGRFFAPIQWVDRQIRTDFWSPTKL